MPITAKLWPNKLGKLTYLAEVAALTRLATGVMRVLENRPSKQKDPNMSESEKRQAMAERFFVEIFGTIGYMICLHLGQDLTDAVVNHTTDQGKSILQQIKKAGLLKNGPAEVQAQAKNLASQLGTDVEKLEQSLQKAVKDVYGENGCKDLIFKFLHGEETQSGKVTKASFAQVKTEFKKEFKDGLSKLGESGDAKVDEAFKLIVNEVQPLKRLAQRGNRLGIAGIVAGVLTSAVVGGTVTQWVNDRLIAPSAKKFFTRKEIQKSIQKNAMSAPQNKTMTIPQPPQPLSLISEAPTLPTPAMLMPQAPVLPAYLPNPKIQSGGALFAARAFNPPSLARPGGPFG